MRFSVRITETDNEKFLLDFSFGGTRELVSLNNLKQVSEAITSHYSSFKIYKNLIKQRQTEEKIENKK